MILSPENSGFAVVRTAFHGGGVVSYHKSLKAAERAQRRHTVPGCTCGCCAVIPVTPEAVAQMHASGYIDVFPLLNRIPAYTGDNCPYRICK